MRESVLIVVLALIPASYATAQIPQVERDALIALYNSTNGANWLYNTNWLGAEGTECDWYGVDCDPDETMVTGIALDENNLDGTLPTTLGNLTNLTDLFLYWNKLTGEIPVELGQLTNLTRLYLNKNHLTGEIPVELGQLTNLTRLYLNNNRLPGPIPAEIWNFDITQLGLSGNRIVGEVPAEITNLTSLYRLQIDYNGMYTTDPAVQAFLDQESGVGWESNQTVAPENLIISSVGDHSAWLGWDAVDYQSDPGGYEVFSAPTGTGVWTSRGWTGSKTETAFPVTGLDPGTAYDFAVVTYTDPHDANQNLVISDFSSEEMATTATDGCAQPAIDVSGTGPFTLALTESYDSHDWSTGETTSSIVVNPTSDQWYWVTVTGGGQCEETAAILIVSTSAPAHIPTAERDALIALYNSAGGYYWQVNTNNWLGAVGTECTWFGVWCEGEHVTAINLRQRNLRGSIPPELGNLSNLEKLTLAENQLSGSIPSELGNLVNLDYLDLFWNQLTGSIPPELGNLSSLTRLYLYTNQLTGSIPPELGNLGNLDLLRLWENQLTGSIPPELGNLANLRFLHLWGNQLSGSIPPELGNLTILRELGLRTNQLTGSIPPELGNMASLDYLLLSSNQLSGSIPPELGNMASLKFLGLSSNQLSGSIPPELGNMASLYSLRLSSNQLSGSIPPELGNLSSLQELYVSSNQLRGEIPVELENLPLLGMYDRKSDLRWNALHSDSATLIAFLNDRQEGGDWQSTQTIAPENLVVDSLGDHTAWLTWDAVSYQSDPGGYEAFSSPTGSGVWTSRGWTEAKTDTSYPVTGLEPATSYSFAVVSYTNPHSNNLNLVNSNFTPQVMVTTASVGCAQPIIEIAWGSPITLSVAGTFDSYLWSTGETTASIIIDPLHDQWYWVTVTSAGPCEETAAKWVGPETVFADGFESGDTTAWSSVIPTPIPQGPFNGPHDIPGKIQAEDFDIGGPTIAYLDMTPLNQGNSLYRSGEQVDIKLISGIVDNGHAIGFMQNTEWLEYTINVASTESNHVLRFRVLSQNDTGRIHAEIDGVDVTGEINVPLTGNWNTDSWATIEVEDITLTAGEHVLRVVVDAQYLDLNWIEITPPPPPATWSTDRSR